MSIGSQFLARLDEAKERKGFKFDNATQNMKNALRDIGGENDFADKIAEVAAMVGIPGRFLNTTAGRKSILEGAGNLKSRKTAATAFLNLHTALLTFHNMSPDEKVVEEAKNSKEIPDDIELEGPFFQQLVEKILIELGVPAELVSSEGKAGIKSPLKKTIIQLSSDTAVKNAFKKLAMRLGLSLTESLDSYSESSDSYFESDLNEEDLEESLKDKKDFDFQRVMAGAMDRDDYNKKYKIGKYKEDKNKLAGLGGIYKNLIVKIPEAQEGNAQTPQELFHAKATELMKALGVDVTTLPNAKMLDRRMALTQRPDAKSNVIILMSKLISALTKNDRS